ncbi:MAG: hypothetical protein AAB677_01805 [Patescibacteria group bacterium]
MPGSHSQQLNEIVEIMILTKPKSILDVGVGFGKYGVLAREYLDLWTGADKKSEAYRHWQTQIDGIEAYRDYLTPLHSFIYNQIYIGDACNIVPSIKNFSYDLILLIDVLEHLNYEEGLRLLNQLRRIGRNVLISTPKIMGEQDTLYGNKFERHIHQWRKTDLVNLSESILIPNEASFIIFSGQNISRIKALVKKKKRQSFHRSLKTLFPFLIFPYRCFKKILITK